MIETIQAWVSTLNWIWFILYWNPVLICTWGYAERTWINYKNDVSAREATLVEKSAGYLYWDRLYTPTDTLGTLLGRVLLTVVPIVNIWAALFDVAPKLLDSFFSWLNLVLRLPLVPRHTNSERK